MNWSASKGGAKNGISIHGPSKYLITEGGVRHNKKQVFQRDAENEKQNLPRDEEDQGVPKRRKPSHDYQRDEENQGAAMRRKLRLEYQDLRNSIPVHHEEWLNTSSGKFEEIIKKVESLHSSVVKPREQLSDGKIILQIACSLRDSATKARAANALSPSDFINAVLASQFHTRNAAKTLKGAAIKGISWRKLGQEASSIFGTAPGLATMTGPMDSTPKKRKQYNSRNQKKSLEQSHPKEVADSAEDELNETAKIVATMFTILKRRKRVFFEALVLNRESFSQTVENIFALSFLVKDGRVEIFLDENKNHVIVPRNAPSAKHMASGEASYNQFILRFDFRDWKLMRETLKSGQELMPDRTAVASTGVPNSIPGKLTSSVTPMSKNAKGASQGSATRQAFNGNSENTSATSKSSVKPMSQLSVKDTPASSKFSEKSMYQASTKKTPARSKCSEKPLHELYEYDTPETSKPMYQLSTKKIVATSKRLEKTLHELYAMDTPAISNCSEYQGSAMKTLTASKRSEKPLYELYANESPAISQSLTKAMYQLSVKETTTTSNGSGIPILKLSENRGR